MMSCALRLSGFWASMRVASNPPSASTPAASLTWVSRSMNAPCTPLAARIASREPAGAFSATPEKVCEYSRVTSAEAPGTDAATASLMEASEAARSAPSWRRTMMPTTRAGSSSEDAWVDEEPSVSPVFEVSAVLSSPTGRTGAAGAAAWGAAGPGSACGVGACGDARDAGAAIASAHAPASATSAAGVFDVIYVTPMCWLSAGGKPKRTSTYRLPHGTTHGTHPAQAASGWKGTTNEAGARDRSQWNVPGPRR